MAQQDWQQQQEQVFVGWVNSVLTRHDDGKGGSVESLGAAFADGVQLIRMVESLAGEGIGVKYKKSTKNKIQAIENINLALTFASDCGLTDRTSTVAAEDFTDNVFTQISGFVWMLFKECSGGSGADDELLEWCGSTAGRVNPGVVVHDFKSSFQDGTVLASIVAASDPPTYSELLSAMSNSSTDKVALVSMATEAARDGDLKVAQLIPPATIAACAADEKSMQMYVALIRMAWDQLAGDRPEAMRLAELEAIIVALRKQLSDASTTRTALKFQLTAKAAQLDEAKAAKQAETARADELQEKLNAMSRQMEEKAQRYANKRVALMSEQQQLKEEISRLQGAAKEATAGQEALSAELEAVKAARIAAAQAAQASDEHAAQAGDEHAAERAAHAAELGKALEGEKAAAERAASNEAAAKIKATEAAATRQQSREIARQAKAAYEDAQIKAESAFRGRKALVEEVDAARRASDELSLQQHEFEAAQGVLAEYSKTAFWSGNASLPYGCQKCGWLDKSASEKDKDLRDDTAGQVAKKQSKNAKSKLADIRGTVWKKRWFVLSGGAMYYYKNDRDTGAEPKGVFFLHSATLHAAAFPESADRWQERLRASVDTNLAVPLEGGDDPLSLRIQGKSITLNLKASTEEERISWGVTIQKHIAYGKYLEGCWQEGRAVPSPHLAQLLLEVTPTDGKSFEHQLATSEAAAGSGAAATAAAAAVAAATSGAELSRVVVPAGSALVAAASTSLLGDLLAGSGGASTTSIKLSRVQMSARGLHSLATQALPALRNLTELDLGYIALQPENGATAVPTTHSSPAAQAVALALPPMGGTLTTLVLDGMPFGTTAAAAALGQALSTLGRLSSLSLADCGIGGDGAAACFGARCPASHPLRPSPGLTGAKCFCDGCALKGKQAIGTSYQCAGGCDFDLCMGCYGERCCARKPCVLPPSLTSLNLSRCDLRSTDIGRVGQSALKDSLRKASKAPVMEVVFVSIAKGPEGGFGMKIAPDGSVDAFSAEAQGRVMAGEVVVGAKIVSVNGIETCTGGQAAVAAALRAVPPGVEGDAEPVVFGLQVAGGGGGGGASAAKPPKPKPPKPSEGVPPAAADPAATEAAFGSIAASLLGVPALRSLQLSGNDLLGDSAVGALAGLVLAPRALPAITELSLAQCGLAEAGLRTVATLMALANGPKSLCVVDLGANAFAGSLIEGVGFGREGRGALYQFDELKMRR